MGIMDFWVGIFVGAAATIILSIIVSDVITINDADRYGNAQLLVEECERTIPRDQFCKVMEAVVIGENK